jgi:hypothetical protein
MLQNRARIEAMASWQALPWWKPWFTPYPSILDGVHGLGQGVHIDFESQVQGLLRNDAAADAAKASPFDGLVQLQSAAPEGLVTEGLEAKDLPALIQHPLAVLHNQLVERVQCSGAASR